MSTTPRQPIRRAVARRGRRARGAVVVVALAVAVAGCGGTDDQPTEAALPVAEAQPVPFEDSGLAPPTSPPPDEPPEQDETSDAATSTGPGDASSPAPTSPPSPTTGPSIGPSNADAAAFIGSDVLADLGGLEHVVVDLDGDTWAEVVATGTKDRRGVVRVAWWTSEGYEVLVETAAGPGRDVTDLRAADVNDDDTTELLVVVEGEGLASLSIWAVPRRGVVEPLEAMGGCHDGTHVYGVTKARLVDQGNAPPAIVADCDDSPLPVADWSEQRWVWDAGAYRFVDVDDGDRGDGGDDDGDEDEGREEQGGNGDGDGGDDGGEDD